TLNVDRHTIICTIHPTYGELPLVWTATATLDGVDVTAQCTFTWTSQLAQIEPDGSSCTILYPADPGLWQISVSAESTVPAGTTVGSATVSEGISIGDDNTATG